MKVFILLSAIVCLSVLQAEAYNTVLGSYSGVSASRFGSGSTETRYANHNGIQEAYTVHTSFEQRPDHTCVKKMVETRNGVKTVREEPIDCKKAEQMINHSQKKTQRDLMEHQQKLDAEIKKQQKDIAKQQKEIEDSIHKQMNQMSSSFFW